MAGSHDIRYKKLFSNPTLVKELVNLFGIWINNFLAYKGREERETITKEIRELAEVKPMFETAVKRYGESLFQQGIEQGELLEKQEILIKLLKRKFNLLEEEVERIKTVTDHEKLDNALEKILFADSKEQVLGLLEAQEKINRKTSPNRQPEQLPTDSFFEPIPVNNKFVGQYDNYPDTEVVAGKKQDAHNKTNNT